MRTLPRIVAPKAGPSLTIAWINAPPTPARSADSSTIAAEAAVASPMPAPAPTITPNTAMYGSPVDTVIPPAIASPIAINRNPKAAVSLAPIRAAMRSAATAPTTRPPISGRNLRPAPWASIPRMAWRYCGSVKSTPNIPKMPTPANTTPTLKLRERKTPRSMRGWT